MNTGQIKYIGTIIEGYQTQKFDSGKTYFFNNVKPGQYDIYDKKGGTLIETIGLRTFNKCFEGLNLPKKKEQSNREQLMEFGETVIQQLLAVFSDYTNEWLEHDDNYISVSLDSREWDTFFYIRFHYIFNNSKFSIERMSYTEGEGESTADYVEFGNIVEPLPLNTDKPYPLADMIKYIRDIINQQPQLNEGLNLPKKQLTLCDYVNRFMSENFRSVEKRIGNSHVLEFIPNDEGDWDRKTFVQFFVYPERLTKLEYNNIQGPVTIWARESYIDYTGTHNKLSNLNDEDIKNCIINYANQNYQTSMVLPEGLNLPRRSFQINDIVVLKPDIETWGKYRKLGPNYKFIVVGTDLEHDSIEISDKKNILRVKPSEITKLNEGLNLPKKQEKTLNNYNDFIELISLFGENIPTNNITGNYSTDIFTYRGNKIQIEFNVWQAPQKYIKFFKVKSNKKRTLIYYFPVDGLSLNQIKDKFDTTKFITISEGLNLPKRDPNTLPTYERVGEFITWEIGEDGDLYVAKIDRSQNIDIQEMMSDLFWNDMDLETFGTEWFYITYGNGDAVFFVNDYGYNKMTDLNKNGQAVFPKSPQPYSEYVSDYGEDLMEGLNLPKKISYELTPGSEMANLLNYLKMCKFATYMDRIVGANDNKIRIDKGGKTVFIEEGVDQYTGARGFFVSLFGGESGYDGKFVNPNEDTLYKLTIEDFIDNFMFEPTDLMEGLNLPKKFGEPVELTTELLPIIDVCMYNTSLDASNLVYDTEILSQEGADKYWDYFDNNLYNDFILDRAKAFIANEIVEELRDLNLGIQDVVTQKIVSPKYYNYGCDSLYYDLVVNSSFNETIVKDILNQNERELNNFLREKFSSSSGFISYMPTDISSLIAGIQTDNERDRCVAAYLTYKLHDKFDEWQEAFVGSCVENHSDLDFLRNDTPEWIIDNMLEELNGNDSVDWTDPDDVETDEEPIQEGLNLPKKDIEYVVKADYEEDYEIMSPSELFKFAESATESLEDPSLPEIVTMEDAIDRLYLAGYRVVRTDEIENVQDGLNEGLNFPKKPKPALHMEPTQVVAYPSGHIVTLPYNIVMDLKNDNIVFYDDEWTEEKPDGQWGYNEDDEWIIEYFIEHQKLPLKYSDETTYIQEHDIVDVDDPDEGDDWQHQFSGTVVGFSGDNALVEDMDNEVFIVPTNKLMKSE